MRPDESPTARALLALELIQNSPGTTADRLAARLGVSERAARRYVGILREAGIPVESTRGPGGGYRVGRGQRPTPLLFTTAEALALVMAVLDGPAPTAAPVGGALGKIMRVLPASVAGPAEAVWQASARDEEAGAASPEPDILAALVQAADTRNRLRLTYRLREDRAMDVDPWAVVVRRGRWYLLCWSHTRDARRVLRVDRVVAVEVLPDTFPPPDVDPVVALEEHLSQGWRHQVDVVVAAPPDVVARWVPRSLGHLTADGDGTRLTGSTDEPDWYARRLTAIQAPFRVVGSPELVAATAALARHLHASVRDA